MKNLTIDERLDALTHTVELLAGMQIKTEERLAEMQAKTEERFQQLAGHVDDLAKSTKRLERTWLRLSADFHTRLMALESDEAGDDKANT